MELRTLEYFLMVAREENITKQKIFPDNLGECMI